MHLTTVITVLRDKSHSLRKLIGVYLALLLPITSGEQMAALLCLQEEITPLNHCTSKLHALPSYLMVSTPTELLARSKWTGSAGNSRNRLIHKIQGTNTRYKVKGSKYETVQNTRYKVQGTRYKVQGTRHVNCLSSYSSQSSCPLR